MLCLRTSDEEKDVTYDEVLCFVTESSPGGDEAQRNHLGGVIVFWDEIDTGAFTSTLSAVH